MIWSQRPEYQAFKAHITKYRTLPFISSARIPFTGGEHSAVRRGKMLATMVTMTELILFSPGVLHRRMYCEAGDAFLTTPGSSPGRVGNMRRQVSALTAWRT